MVKTICMACGHKFEKEVELGVMIKCPGCDVIFMVEKGGSVSGQS